MPVKRPEGHRYSPLAYHKDLLSEIRRKHYTLENRRLVIDTMWDAARKGEDHLRLGMMLKGLVRRRHFKPEELPRVIPFLREELRKTKGGQDTLPWSLAMLVGEGLHSGTLHRNNLFRLTPEIRKALEVSGPEPSHVANVLSQGLKSGAIVGHQVARAIKILQKEIDEAKARGLPPNEFALALDPAITSRTLRHRNLAEATRHIRDVLLTYPKNRTQNYGIYVSFSEALRTLKMTHEKIPELGGDVKRAYELGEELGSSAYYVSQLLNRGFYGKVEDKRRLYGPPLRTPADLRKALDHAELSLRKWPKHNLHTLLISAWEANHKIGNLDQTFAIQNILMEKGFPPTPKLVLKYWRARP